MIKYPDIDPVIIKIGPLSIRWYGLMYIFGFTSSYLLTLYQLRKNRSIKMERPFIDDLYFYLILGLIIGARLGYIIFYNLDFYISNPFEVFVVWHGGMSFHGGLAGAFIAGYLVIKKWRHDFFSVADLIIPTCPIGIGFGRIGNFINGELFGKPSDVPWAMIFPNAGNIARHPSQLYEAFLEGIVLFLVLWLYKNKKRHEGDVFSLFLMLYGIFRIFCEYFREPDQQIGYLLGFFTMGQALSIFMILFGLFLRCYYLPRRKDLKW
ncbi:MAG TPA: prolipoprotein diacylglyceryl transferase [Syntrophorhabdaceae bacterium]|nr:prolipoprotein diacylglyceryl transferase [Syntrophorhabdaceae bacterium]HPL40855.1 prolipoprotein diacylglyceryl transferase [Syntrophorhabdaceae bacterium]